MPLAPHGLIVMKTSNPKLKQIAAQIRKMEDDPDIKGTPAYRHIKGARVAVEKEARIRDGSKRYEAS